MITEIITLLALLYAQPKVQGASNVALSTHTLSMEDRYDNSFVNNVFRYNILLATRYMGDLDKSNVDSPFTTEFILKPGEVFAFHEHTLPEYKNVVKTMNSNFMGNEGYKSDGFLVGDGVCHLASIIYWAAKDAGLSTYAPSNHNFAKINDVPKEYGVAIESPMPLGNLYITNNQDKPVTFSFSYDGKDLRVSVLKEV